MNNDFIPVEIAEAERKKQELQAEFNFEGYQVVRRELFAHLRDPAVIIRRDSIAFNNSCIEGLEDTIYIQILINPTIHKLLIRKCDEYDKNALRWCIAKEEGRKSRQITSRDFSNQLFRLLDWDKRNRYKVLGYRINYNNEALYIFDLVETEIFDDTKRKDPHFEEELKRLNSNDTPNNQKGFNAENVATNFGQPLEDVNKSLSLENISDYVSSVDNIEEVNTYDRR